MEFKLLYYMYLDCARPGKKCKHIKNIGKKNNNNKWKL